MSNEPSSNLETQVGYLTRAVEALRDDFKEHRSELRSDLVDFRNDLHDHIKEDIIFQKHIIHDVETVNHTLARQRGFIAGVLFIASAVGGLVAWATGILLK